jgi:NTP pyrophosphatase (non-canonical NTP hydrolase)
MEEGNEMEFIRDRQLIEIDYLTKMVIIENEKQLSKWGIQTHTPFEWLAYLTEEVGELSQAISEEHYRDGAKSAVIDEAIQVATVVLKIAEGYL